MVERDWALVDISFKQPDEHTVNQYPSNVWFVVIDPSYCFCTVKRNGSDDNKISLNGSFHPPEVPKYHTYDICVKDNRYSVPATDLENLVQELEKFGLGSVGKLERVDIAESAIIHKVSYKKYPYDPKMKLKVTLDSDM